MVNELKQVSLRDNSNDRDEENKNSQATPSKNPETTMDVTDSDCNRTETSIAGGSDTITGDEGSEMTAMSCAIGSQGVESDRLELPMEVVTNGDSAGVLQPVDCSAMKETDLSSHGVTREDPGRTVGGGRRMNSGRKTKE